TAQPAEEPAANEEPAEGEDKTEDTAPDADQESETSANGSMTGDRQGVVTIGGETWEFEMNIACGGRFDAITFVGQNAEGSASIAGGVSDYEDDAGFEIKVVDGPEWALQPGSSYVIEDRTVRGTGDFHNERNPGETASGEFEITC